MGLFIKAAVRSHMLGNSSACFILTLSLWTLDTLQCRHVDPLDLNLITWPTCIYKITVRVVALAFNHQDLF